MTDKTRHSLPGPFGGRHLGDYTYDDWTMDLKVPFWLTTTLVALATILLVGRQPRHRLSEQNAGQLHPKHHAARF
jgi:hypothetical protein